MAEHKSKKLPLRSEVETEDTWDLTRVFPDDNAWETAYEELLSEVKVIEKYRNKLGRSAAMLCKVLEFEAEFSKKLEQLGIYAFLKSTEDVANSTYQGMVARFTYLATQAGEYSSFVAPEIQAIPDDTMQKFLGNKKLAPYRIQLEKLLRFKPHILSEQEERLLAMQGEVAQTPSNVFGQLNDADLDFGAVRNEDGEEVALTQSSFRSLLESPKRAVRKKAFEQFYRQYEAHKNTLAATLSGSVLQDVYQARVRNYDSALEAALFSDKVPESVYDALLETVEENLDAHYRYVALRKKALRCKDIRAFDMYTPLQKSARVDIPYDQAVGTICEALAPLGDEYVDVLRKGLLEARWVDRYENKGKRSGAFSYGAYGTPPYIMMNYKSDVQDSMFTLAHEAGHSMHTHYSANHQPYQYSHYTIFVAEVASTFNEQLLSHYLLERATTKKEKIQLINREIDEIRGTIIRQTMFATYERVIHTIAETGQPLTIDVLRGVYRKLLEQYFGEDFTIDETLDLEGLRIPHFYRAFYVYKYATGLSAAIVLAQKVLQGETGACERYLDFLKSGSSKYPLDLLRDAGVDLEQPDAVRGAMQRFRSLVEELETLM